MTLVEQSLAQLVAHKSCVGQQKRLLGQVTEHLVQMPAFAVGSRAGAEVPREGKARMPEGRHKHLRCRLLAAGAAQSLLIGGRMRTFQARSVDGQQTEAIAISEQSRFRSHLGAETPLESCQDLRRFVGGGLCEAGVGPPELPVRMPVSGSVPGELESGRQRLSFTPSHQKIDPRHPLRRPQRSLANRPLRKNPGGRQSCIATNSELRYDSFIVRASLLSVSNGKIKIVAEARTSQIPIPCAPFRPRGANGVAWHPIHARREDPDHPNCPSGEANSRAATRRAASIPILLDEPATVCRSFCSAGDGSLPRMTCERKRMADSRS